MIVREAGTGDFSVAVRLSRLLKIWLTLLLRGNRKPSSISSGLDNLLEAVRNVFASLYNDRAISYRVHKGFIHSEVALSVGVQRMVRSDIGASGVMFTLDTETGFDQVVFITASYGLG